MVSHRRFRLAAAAGLERDEFFRSGEEHTARVLRIVRNSLAADFTPHRALDFGCGVGRILLPLARVADEVIGVDISTAMLEEARRNCAGVANLELYLADDSLTALRGRTFDFIHSFIVMQHIPTPRGMTIVRALLEHLSAGGVGVLHVPYAHSGPRARRLARTLFSRIPLLYSPLNLLRGQPTLTPVMEMNLYPVDRLLELLQDCGCHRIAVRFSDHAGYLGILLFFQRLESTPF